MKIAAEMVGVSYGVLSAYAGRPGSQDEELHGRLEAELRDAGYSPLEAKGEWEGVPELCWAIPGIGMDDLVEFARKYGQEAVVFCPRGGRPRVLQVGGVPKPRASRPSGEAD